LQVTQARLPAWFRRLGYSPSKVGLRGRRRRRHVINHDYIRKLMAAGIIAKAAIDGDGRRVRYTLTERAGKVLGDLYRQTDDLR
jgi:DNA-binding MarR family transcriptional regulator